MKKKLFCMAFFAFLLLSKILVAGSNDQFLQYLSSSTVASSLETPANLTGKGLQLSGLSSSPNDIQFSWAYNSEFKHGYKFQRRFSGIYWDFGCEVNSWNAVGINHHLSFAPQRTENFRMFSFLGSTKSAYAYVTVEMLRPDLTIFNVSLDKTSVTPGATVNSKCQIRNVGTFNAGASIISYYLSTNSTYESGDVLLGSQSVPALSISSATGVLSKSLTMPSNLIGGQKYYILFFANKPGEFLEISRLNNLGVLEINGVALPVTQKDLTITNIEVSGAFSTWDDTETDETKTKTYQRAHEGDLLNFAVTVKNIATGSSAGSTGIAQVSLNISPDNFIYPEKDAQGFYYTSNDFLMFNLDGYVDLTPGQSVELLLQTYVGSVTDKQTKLWNVVCYVDLNNDVKEIKEDNNKFFTKIYLTSTETKKSADINNNLMSNNDNLQSVIEIFPNPSNGMFSLNNLNNFEMLEVADVKGSIIYSAKLEQFEGTYHLDLTGNKSGVYFVKAFSKNNVINKKIIIN